jgi:hypothetical protein
VIQLSEVSEVRVALAAFGLEKTTGYILRRQRDVFLRRQLGQQGQQSWRMNKMSKFTTQDTSATCIPHGKKLFLLSKLSFNIHPGCLFIKKLPVVSM